MCAHVRRPQKPKHPGPKGKVTKPRTKARGALNSKIPSKMGAQVHSNITYSDKL